MVVRCHTCQSSFSSISTCN